MISFISVTQVIPQTFTNLLIASPRQLTLATITLWVSSFLCLLNIALAIIFRKKKKSEVISYYTASIIELAIFLFALLFILGVITRVPYHLPPGLAVDRVEIGAALAIGMGLFPAAYWHRINMSELPKRIAQDAQAIKDRNAGVHVRKGAPGEWMN